MMSLLIVATADKASYVLVKVTEFSVLYIIIPCVYVYIHHFRFGVGLQKSA